jgi:hypothetical protein
MKRKRPVHFLSRTKRPRGRNRGSRKLNQIEDRFAILLLLLQHNIDKLLRTQRRMSRR